MHGDDDVGFSLANHLGSLGRAERILTADWNEQDVRVSNFLELFFLQRVSQVSQVTDHKVIHVNDINRIAPAFRATFCVVVGRDACNQHVADLVFSRAAHHARIPVNAFYKVVAGMVVTDGDDGGSDLAQLERFPLGLSWLRRKGIGYQGNIFATQHEARVAEP